MIFKRPQIFYRYIFIFYRRALGARRKFWRTRYQKKNNYAISFEIALYILTIQDCAIIKDEGKNDGLQVHAPGQKLVSCYKEGTNHVFSR